MTDRPLLFFPLPEKTTRSIQGSGTPKVHRPSTGRQGERLAPKFDQLRKHFTHENAEVYETVSGVDPEQVLVFETIGSIDNFANAVKKIEGFEWLGEIELDEIAPDNDFYDEKNKDKPLSGRLYLILSNLRALDEMLSLWKRFQDDPAMKWEHGWTKYRDVFLNLKDVRRWGIQERLTESGVLEFWKEELEAQGNQLIPFELELWFRKDADKRQKSIDSISRLITERRGNIRQIAIIEGIHYIGILADLPAETIQEIIDHSEIKLAKSDEIMYFRAVGQMAVSKYPTDGEPEKTPIDENMPLPQGEPTIAILDGLPLANHRLLAGRVRIDDPDQWEIGYLAQERKHGTAMSSLIIHGDLNAPSLPLSRPVYVRPIFKPIRWQTASSVGQNLTGGREGIPRDCLMVDLIHRAVKRLFDGEAEFAPVAPQIKVINLALGDEARPFFQTNSPLARLLDWLSNKYNVLFIVSAGNYTDPIVFDMHEQELKAMELEGREAKTVKTLYQDLRNRRLLSPAESINALTIGALHSDSSPDGPLGCRIDLVGDAFPSPVSAFGSGYRKSVKPDMVFNGGKQLYTPSVTGQNGQTEMELRGHTIPPGIRTACPGQLPGDLDATSHSCGTSNATALVSRSAGICYDSLLEILAENEKSITARQEIALLKAMLVHGCSWGDIAERIDKALRHPDFTKKRSDYFKSHISRWLGYGVPQVSRVLNCSGQRATLLGYGELKNDEANLFQLPLPPSLSGIPTRRRLTVTLAWLSPISVSTQKYRTAQLWFGLKNDAIANIRRDVDWNMVRRGTVQHEVFEKESAVPYPDDDILEIKVNCKNDAGKIESPVAYGLIVSLEVGEGTGLPVYNEVRNRIRSLVPVRPVNP